MKKNENKTVCVFFHCVCKVHCAETHPFHIFFFILSITQTFSPPIFVGTQIYFLRVYIMPSSYIGIGENVQMRDLRNVSGVECGCRAQSIHSYFRTKPFNFPTEPLIFLAGRQGLASREGSRSPVYYIWVCVSAPASLPSLPMLFFSSSFGGHQHLPVASESHPYAQPVRAYSLFTLLDGAIASPRLSRPERPLLFFSFLFSYSVAANAEHYVNHLQWSFKDV